VKIAVFYVEIIKNSGLKFKLLVSSYIRTVICMEYGCNYVRTLTMLTSGWMNEGFRECEKHVKN
jgi:hypothetical protein